MKPDLPAPQPSLVRALGPMIATAVIVGTVIGSGIFKKPQSVAADVPQFGLAALVWTVGGLVALLGALTLAEVSVLYPKAGGNYVFLREGFGRLAGFLWGWVEFWIIRTGSLAALAVVFSESCHDILRNPSFQRAFQLDLGDNPLGDWEDALTVSVLFGLAGVNVLGVRWGGVLQLVVTIVKVASLLAILALPFVVAILAKSRAESSVVSWQNLTPVWPADWSQFDPTRFVSALFGVQWAYHGWMNLAPVAEELRRPQRNIPLAMIAGVGIVIFLYLSVNLAFALVIPAEEMATLTKTSVAAEFGLRLLPSVGAVAASAAVMCSVFGTLNGNLLVGPRLLYAMGEDGLAPKALGRVHPRFRTPAWAIAAMALWSSLLVLGAAVLIRYRLPVLRLGDLTLDPNLPLGKSPFNILTDYAMFGAIIFESLAVATIFVFRRRFPHVERPYRCWGYPWVPALYMVIMALVLVNTFVRQRTEAMVGVSFIAFGAAVYGAVFARWRHRGQAEA